PLPPAGHELVVQIQESAIDNPASELLAGRAVTDVELAGFISSIFPDFRPDLLNPRDEAAEAEVAVESEEEDQAGTLLEAVEAAREAAEAARNAAERLTGDPLTI